MTKFRDVIIFDGKGNKLTRFDGSSGQVGINTDPNLDFEGLHIKGSGAELQLETTSANAVFVGFNNDTTRKAYFGYRPVDEAFKISHSEY